MVAGYGVDVVAFLGRPRRKPRQGAIHAGQADHVQFEIEDNGIGMDQETREKAFSLFFSSKGTEGTGLGLFISDRIARSHGGTIELESQPGVGTRFVVKLPRKGLPRQEPEDLDLPEKETFHD